MFPITTEVWPNSADFEIEGMLTATFDEDASARILKAMDAQPGRTSRCSVTATKAEGEGCISIKDITLELPL